MPVYDYEALNEKGDSIKGVIDADTAKQARDKLRLRKIHVTKMVQARKTKRRKAEREASEVSKFSFKLPKFGGAPGRQDIPMVTRQLSTLLRAGIPLAESINALIEQIEQPELERTFRQIKEDISTGVTTTEAFARHPQYFNPLFVNMIKAGEASGNLDTILNRLANFLQKQSKTKGKVSAAMTYPLVMVALGTLVVGFLMKFVVPKIVGGIVERGGKLPLPTAILKTSADFVSSYWWLILLAVAGVWMLYKAWVATPEGRLKNDTWLLKMPIFGVLFKKQAVSRFTTTFSTLLKSGVPALEALRILRDIVDNALMAKTLETVHDRILEGADIATPLKRSGVFPPVVAYMIAIGEQSGQLEEILEKISESYDEEIEITISQVMAMIEPLVILGLALVVGFIVLAVILPLVDSFQNIG